MKEQLTLNCTSTRFSIFHNPLFEKKVHSLQLEAHRHSKQSSQSFSIENVHHQGGSESDLSMLKQLSKREKKRIFSCEKRSHRNPLMSDAFQEDKEWSRSSSKKKHKIFEFYTSPNLKKTPTFSPIIQGFQIEEKKDSRVNIGESEVQQKKIFKEIQQTKKLQGEVYIIKDNKSHEGCQKDPKKNNKYGILTPEQLFDIVYQLKSKRIPGKRIQRNKKQ